LNWRQVPVEIRAGPVKAMTNGNLGLRRDVEC